MFSERKSFWRGKWYYFLIAGLLGLGYWFNTGFDKGAIEPGPDTSTAVRQPADQSPKTEKDNKEDVSLVDSIPDQSSETDAAEKNESYYTIIEEGGVIKIYYCNEDGQQLFLRDTEISFSMLSETDQALFREGIRKNSKEELDELMQDFES